MQLIHKWTEGPVSKEYLGGKGQGLAEMVADGLPVPPGLTIPVPVMWQYRNAIDKTALLHQIAEAVEAALVEIEEDMGRKVLVSVRSGAPVSMPGMMDTVLNVGITAENVDALGGLIGADVARRCYEAFIGQLHDLMFGEKHSDIASMAVALADHLPDSHTRKGQIAACVKLVFDSWFSARAISYRKENSIPDSMGTACNVQVMVYGNLNECSGTGVLFTRNPSTGENKVYGEFLQCAQGEAVVSGEATPVDLHSIADAPAFVSAYDALIDTVIDLEERHRDMQDVEFTIEDGKLFILQARTGKRSAKAAFQIAYDMAKEGLITEKEAVARVSASQLTKVTTPTVDKKKQFWAEGLAASAGVVTGAVVYTSEAAVKAKGPVILVTPETKPDDFDGMKSSVGVLTGTGGMTSHAAVVARAMDKPCIVGCSDLKFVNGIAVLAGKPLSETTVITIDGSTGRVYGGKVEAQEGAGIAAVKEVLEWAMTGQTYLWRPDPSEPLTDETLSARPVARCTHVYVDTRSYEKWDGLMKSEFDDLMAFLKAKSDSYRFIVDLRSEEGEYDFIDRTAAGLMGKGGNAMDFKSALKLDAAAKHLIKTTAVVRTNLCPPSDLCQLRVATTVGHLLESLHPIMVDAKLMKEQNLTAGMVQKIAELAKNGNQIMSDPIPEAFALK